MSTENTMDTENETEVKNEDLSLEERIAKIDEEYQKEEAGEENQPTPEASSEPAAASEESGAEVAEEQGQVVEDQYTPDLTYRVHDKEFNFDDKVASFIKSKEDEDYFRDLFTKAAGVDVIKPKLEREREERASLMESYVSLENKTKELNSNWEYFQNLVDSGAKGDQKSVNSLLDALNIPDNVLGQIVADRLERTPEQKEYQSQLAASQYENYQMKSQLENSKHEYSDMEYKMAEFQLNQAIESANEAKGIINKVDQVLGEGAFKKEVTDLGIHLEEQAIKNNSELPTYEQVIGLVADKYNKLMGGAQESAPAPQTQEAPKTQASQPKIEKRIVTNNKNTLPNLGSGNGESPVGRAINSIADLEAERDEHFNTK